jgi:myo-inositol-1(or 4)-monophosphatase
MKHPLLDVAMEAFETARSVLAIHGNSVIDTKSSPTDVVTAADREIEHAIQEVIRKRRPNDSFLGEEFGNGSNILSSTRWVIDPIDGTVNYTYAIPNYAISIAAEVDGKSEVGLVYDAGHEELFVAVAGQGAEMNGRPIMPSHESKLSQALCATGFGYDKDKRKLQARLLAKLIDKIRDVRRFGAAAIDICWVANGRLDGYFETGLKVWDYAAASLIAVESGAAIETDLPGIMDEPMVISANPELYPLLKKEVLDALS